jgi:hypothetical protein
MISCVSLFTTITALVSTSVKLPNGDLVSITHIGTVQISEHLILTNVLYVPSFSFNLISVAKLIKQLKCCLILINNYCFIQNLVKWRTIGVGEEKDGLLQKIFIMILMEIFSNHMSCCIILLRFLSFILMMIIICFLMKFLMK